MVSKVNKFRNECKKMRAVGIFGYKFAMPEDIRNI